MIRVLVPDMPRADELLPYLREIDGARWYSNGGPLAQRLAAKLAHEVIGAPCALVSNGTAALELALRALDLPHGAGVLVPATTFVATGQAIVNAGLVPVLCDVNGATWKLQATQAMRMLRTTPLIRAALPVAAFGSPVDVAAWQDVAKWVPVVVDAAGALFDQRPCDNPRFVYAYSLHATKALGCGEGGVVASANTALVERVASMAAFGPGGTNAKLDEYRAAVALAGLARTDRPDWRRALDRLYASGLPRSVVVQAGPPLSARTLLPVLLPEGAQTAKVAQALAALGIETRQWYAPFLHARPEFARYPRASTALPVTELLADRLLGLPYHYALAVEDVQRVCGALAQALETADA
jgi:dTDP-4-amino-4,6-dideoxygalactose transaminase